MAEKKWGVVKITSPATTKLLICTARSVKMGVARLENSICKLMGYGESTEVKANARLIAAAPELLEVCQLIDEEVCMGRVLQEKLNAAIAKATGKE